MAALDASIAEWRAAVTRSRAVTPGDADELESHLRDQMADLRDAGLADDEAFLIAVKRLGATDRLTAEYAREHGDRLWKQLAPASASPESGRRPFVEMLVFAAIAAVVIQIARVAAQLPDGDGTLSPYVQAPWFMRDLGLFVLPVLAAYFVRVRRISLRTGFVLTAIVAVLAVAINLFPFALPSQTEPLAALHLVVVLWFIVLAAYLGGDARSSSRRMDAIRFSGEFAIYYVLIALGGGVLVALTGLVLTPIAPDAIDDVLLWVVPSGAAAATVVAAWLVEAKKGVIENLAPVLTAIFTPLFAALLVVAAVGYVVAGIGRDFDRELLTGFDALLLVVVALVLYGLSAREPAKPAGAMDVLRLIAVVAAVVLDALVLASMLARVGDFGLTPNRVAALGLNVLLIVDLAVTAVLGLLPARNRLARVERWLVGFVPVFGVWAAAMVLVLPPVFGFA